MEIAYKYGYLKSTVEIILLRKDLGQDVRKTLQAALDYLEGGEHGQDVQG